MRFCQIDQIISLEPGKRIEALRSLVGSEDYLRDHFPRFAVMPGVMMLESLTQAATMLVRATDEFRTGLVLLRTAKNVKFADFVQPGQTLRIVVELIKQEGDLFTLKASGTKEDKTAVSGRLVLEVVRSAGGDDVVDRHAAQYMRQKIAQLQEAAMG